MTPSYALRPYQQEADAAIDRELALHRSTLVIMATGTGKTVLFASQARKRGGGLILAHRDSLIKQAAAKLRQETGEYVAIEKAERTAFASPYICASVQTLRGRRLDDFAARFQKTVRFIVTDEAHRAVAKSYRDIYAAFPDAQLLFVTATGDRSDKVGMGNVADSVAFRYDIDRATDDGWLTPHKFVPVFCEADLDKVSLKGRGANRDFDQAQLDGAIEACAADTARALLDQCGSHRLIVFTPGVRTALATTAALNKLRPGCAYEVDGETDDLEKDRIQDRHREGEFQYLVNCRVYTEGYDDPTLDGIFDSAPTKSRSLAAQKWGRPNRLCDEKIGRMLTAAERRAAIAASAKPWAMVYDLTCNMSDHLPIGPADVLSGLGLTDDDRKRVNAKIRKEGGDVKTALAEVRREQEEEKQAQAARAALIARQRRSRVGQARTIWDILKVGTLDRGDPTRPIVRRPEDEPSAKVMARLQKWGVPVPPNVSRKGAVKLMRTEWARRKAGLCKLAGVSWLQRYGIQAWNLSSSRAKRIQQAIIANGHKPLAPAHLAVLMERTAGEEG